MFSPAALGIAYLLAVAWPLAKTDWLEHRLPNKLVLPAFPITIVGQLTELLFGSNFQRLFHAIAISLLVFALGLLMNRFAGLGMGDVKLLAAMALALAWFSAAAVFGSIMIALLLAVSYVVIRARKLAGSAIALGPYLLAGFIAQTAVLAIY